MNQTTLEKTLILHRRKIAVLFILVGLLIIPFDEYGVSILLIIIGFTMLISKVNPFYCPTNLGYDEDEE